MAGAVENQEKFERYDVGPTPPALAVARREMADERQPGSSIPAALEGHRTCGKPIRPDGSGTEPTRPGRRLLIGVGLGFGLGLGFWLGAIHWLGQGTTGLALIAAGAR